MQGDEPELSGSSIDVVVSLLQDNPSARDGHFGHADSRARKTARSGLRKSRNGANPKRITGFIFQPSPIPHAREWRDELLHADPPYFFQHLGLYAYRRDFLLQFASLRRTPLEKLENLEQLRALEHGHEIVVGIVDEPTIGIDTPADYAAFVVRYRQNP